MCISKSKGKDGKRLRQIVVNKNTDLEDLGA